MEYYKKILTDDQSTVKRIANLLINDNDSYLSIKHGNETTCIKVVISDQTTPERKEQIDNIIKGEWINYYY
jgi:hypothetical protein